MSLNIELFMVRLHKNLYKITSSVGNEIFLVSYACFINCLLQTCNIIMIIFGYIKICIEIFRAKK